MKCAANVIVILYVECFHVIVYMYNVCTKRLFHFYIGGMQLLLRGGIL